MAKIIRKIDVKKTLQSMEIGDTLNLKRTDAKSSLIRVVASGLKPLIFQISEHVSITKVTRTA